jgi:hypothetical protein
MKPRPRQPKLRPRRPGPARSTAFKLCKSMDAVATGYFAQAKKDGKETKPAVATARLCRPGPVCLHAAATGSSRVACPAAAACGYRRQHRPWQRRPRSRVRYRLRRCPLPAESCAAAVPADGHGPARVWPLVPGAPRLTQARCELLREIQILDEYGDRRSIHIPAERPLTVFVDKREIVTLMTWVPARNCWCWATCATSASSPRCARSNRSPSIGTWAPPPCAPTRACRHCPVDRPPRRDHGLRPGHRVWRRAARNSAA